MCPTEILNLNSRFSLIGSNEELLSKFLERTPNERLFLDHGAFTDAQLGSVVLQASFPAFLPRNVYVEPEEELVEEGMKWIQSFLEEYGVIRKEECTSSSRNLSYARDIMSKFSGVFFPYGGLKDELARLFTAWFVLAVWTDDFMEQSRMFEDNPKMIFKIRFVFQEVLKGIPSPKELPNVYPAIGPSVRAMTQTMRRLRDSVPGFEENRLPMANCVYDTFLALYLFQVEEGRIPDVVFRSIKMRDGGYMAFLECLSLCKELVLPAEIRNSFLFRAATEHFAALCAAANDVAGLKRDIINGETYTLILHRVAHGGLSLQQSFDLRCKEVQDEFDSFLYACKSLRQVYTESDELDEFILYMAIIADRHFLSLVSFARYIDL
jgi:hypothetical protein